MFLIILSLIFQIIHGQQFDLKPDQNLTLNLENGVELKIENIQNFPILKINCSSSDSSQIFISGGKSGKIQECFQSSSFKSSRWFFMDVTKCQIFQVKIEKSDKMCNFILSQNIKQIHTSNFGICAIFLILILIPSSSWAYKRSQQMKDEKLKKCPEEGQKLNDENQNFQEKNQENSQENYLQYAILLLTIVTVFVAGLTQKSKFEHEECHHNYKCYSKFFHGLPLNKFQSNLIYLLDFMVLCGVGVCYWKYRGPKNHKTHAYFTFAFLMVKTILIHSAFGFQMGMH